MASEIQQIKDVAWGIIADPRATRIERLEALKLIAATRGLLIPELDERWLTVRQIAGLRRIKRDMVERVLKQKARKARANRKAYLRRRIRELEAEQAQRTEGGQK
jgi:hypothetical protein